MMECERLTVEFVEELTKTASDDYLEIKMVLLAVAKEKPRLIKFLHSAFEFAEKRRPLLIEMKEDEPSASS